MDNHSAWADALRKAKQSTQKASQTIAPNRVQVTEAQLQEQLDYYKMKLLEAAKQKQTQTIADLCDRLINTHARFTALLIKEEKENGESEDSPRIEAHLKKYFDDCSRLLEEFPNT